MTKLLRITRHQLTDEMRRVLDEKFGVNQWEATDFTRSVSEKRLRELAQSGEWDWVEVVLPPWMTEIALQLWPNKVIRSLHERKTNKGKTSYTFTNYVQVVKVEMVVKPWT